MLGEVAGQCNVHVREFVPHDSAPEEHVAVGWTSQVRCGRVVPGAGRTRPTVTPGTRAGHDTSRGVAP